MFGLWRVEKDGGQAGVGASDWITGIGDGGSGLPINQCQRIDD